eukprot:1564115-Prorocentrum_lima.AAC.1
MTKGISRGSAPAERMFASIPNHLGTTRARPWALKQPSSGHRKILDKMPMILEDPCRVIHPPTNC